MGCPRVAGRLCSVIPLRRDAPRPAPSPAPRFSIHVEAGAGELRLTAPLAFDFGVVRALHLRLPDLAFPLSLRGGPAAFRHRYSHLLAADIDVDLGRLLGFAGLQLLSARTTRRAGRLAWGGEDQDGRLAFSLAWASDGDDVLAFVEQARGMLSVERPALVRALELGAAHGLVFDAHHGGLRIARPIFGLLAEALLRHGFRVPMVGAGGLRIASGVDIASGVGIASGERIASGDAAGGDRTSSGAGPAARPILRLRYTRSAQPSRTVGEASPSFEQARALAPMVERLMARDPAAARANLLGRLEAGELDPRLAEPLFRLVPASRVTWPEPDDVAGIHAALARALLPPLNAARVGELARALDGAEACDVLAADGLRGSAMALEATQPAEAAALRERARRRHPASATITATAAHSDAHFAPNDVEAWVASPDGDETERLSTDCVARAALRAEPKVATSLVEKLAAQKRLPADEALLAGLEARAVSDLARGEVARARAALAERDGRLADAARAMCRAAVAHHDAVSLRAAIALAETSQDAATQKEVLDEALNLVAAGPARRELMKKREALTQSG